MSQNSMFWVDAGIIVAVVFPKTCFSIFGFLRNEKRITKSVPGLEVTDGSVPMVVPMAAQVGVPGLEVTDGSYGGSYGSYGCPGRDFPASKLRMVPMVIHMVRMAAQVGFAASKLRMGFLW